MIPAPVLLVLVAIEGWSESIAEYNYSLLRKVLENIPGVIVVVPNYLDATGKFTRLRSHLTLEEYASTVGKKFVEVKRKYPDTTIMVMGHGLGGIIARLFCKMAYFPATDMILAGTPNIGMRPGWLKTGLYKVLASKHLCNVPVFYQLLPGSKFLMNLNESGVPEDACYISSIKDRFVRSWSSDPLHIGYYTESDLFPRKENLLRSSAIPIIENIIKKKLEKIKATS